jgi:sigma-B regulation protein RsbU (phosphoserine phosphatase)
VTVFYGVFDLETGGFEYCNAGHNPTYLLRSANGQQAEALKRTGVALGAMEGLTWKSASLSLEKGDILLFYTDGVVEAQNESDEFYGDEQLVDVARTHAASPAETIHTKIMESLNSFVGMAAQFDDITLLTLKRE